MKNLKKGPREEGDADADDDSSSISLLPDEIILQILNKLIDLKTLFCCYLVSKRFSFIVVQVNAAISFTIPPIKNTVVAPGTHWLSFTRDSLVSGMTFLFKFTNVQYLSIEVPSSFSNNCSLFKWKVKFSSRVESVIFLYAHSICGKDGFYVNGSEDGEDDVGYFQQKSEIGLHCLREALLWHSILLSSVKILPMLEKISITDSEKRGRLSLSGEKLNEAKKEWIHISSLEVPIPTPQRVSKCYIPVLSLPVSGYVMKGICCSVMEVKDLQGGTGTTGNDHHHLLNLINNSEKDCFEQEAAAYTEAMKEILEKHMDLMLTRHVVE